jgi:predicted glycosyltransferase
MGPRLLFYSHDSFGLGHLRRTLALARAVGEEHAAADSLILTGSSLSSSYRLPPRVDTVKLPVLTKDTHGRYRAARLGTSVEDTLALRSRLAAAAAEAFAPDVTVVDKTPLGLRGELLPALELLRARGRGRLVLGMRDVEDSAARVRREWGRAKIRRAVERYYDAILVYGPRSSPDALRCMDWDDLPMAVHHVGYVGSPMPDLGPPDLPADYLLVSAGGGADGTAVVEAAIRAVRLRSLARPTVIVTGPLMLDADVRRLFALARGTDVQLYEFRADMESVMAGARAVVAMAGYNTVAEILRARKPALLIPRVRPRQEQLVRAQELAAKGQAELLHPDELDAETLRARLDGLLSRPAPVPIGAAHGGARRAARLLLDLARDAEPQLAARASA